MLLIVIGMRSAAADEAYFESKVRPLLLEHCAECHSAKHGIVEANFNIDSRTTLLGGGDRGIAVVAGMPQASLLMRAVRYDDTDLEMPPSGKLPDEDVQILRKWIADGAVMPEGTPVVSQQAGVDFEKGRQHWAYRPLVDSKSSKLDSEVIDYWVRRGQRKTGVRAQTQAAPEILIRRLAFTLTGLPPTFEEVEDFRADPTSSRYNALVEDYLARPQYGERWARHWLDLVRYTDTTASWLKSTAGAWRYRDWVVKAFNEDLAYDQFVKYQFASDTQPEAGPEDLRALGMLGLSPTYWKEPRLAPVVLEAVIAEEWEERIDMVGRTFLGMSLACARCHDHKFDPISQRDYYALAGVFANTRILDVAIVAEDKREVVREADARIGDLNRLIHRESLARSTADDKTIHDKRIAEAKAKIAELKKVTETAVQKVPGVVDASIGVIAESADMSKVVYDEMKMVNVAVQHRGNPATKGEVMPRRFLELFNGEKDTFNQGSGRAELANALFQNAEFLVARVIVNRVWGHHFGQHLVATPSDFGFQGHAPTHPELLDALAMRLIENEWSLKWLHRIILQSQTFKQGSVFNARFAERDPENQFYWKIDRRRLDIEAWRDSMLTVSGRLDNQIGGAPIDLSDPANNRRTIYSMVKRRELHDVLKMHGFPEPTGHSPKREDVDTPLQQLYALNSDFIWDCAMNLSGEVDVDVPVDVLVSSLYQRILVRMPSETELILGLEFLAEEKNRSERLVRYVHTLLISNEFAFLE